MCSKPASTKSTGAVGCVTCAGADRTRMVCDTSCCDCVGETDCGDDAEVDGVGLLVVLISSEVYLAVPAFRFCAAGVCLRSDQKAQLDMYQATTAGVS